MRLICACMLAIVLIAGRTDAARAAAPGAERARAVTYSAPAALRPAGGAVLPDGRLIAPAGQVAAVGSNPLGVALSPDGRYAITSNDDQRAGRMSLSVVDTESMQTVFEYFAPGVSFFAGVVALRDPAVPSETLVLASDGPHGVVRVFDLGPDGRLVPDRIPTIAIPGPLDANFVDLRRSFPATLVASSDGRSVYVVNNVAGTVSTIDVRTRSLSGAALPVGFFPFGAVLAGGRLLVANEGLMRYRRLGSAAVAPPFAAVAPDLARASSLSVVSLDDQAGLATNVPMDQTPDGLRSVGSAHPAAIAATPDGAYAFVAMAGVDRVATVALGDEPHVIGGIELRLFDRGPYGTQPDALALSRDGTRLYVALAGLDAVAVLDARDPVHLHRMGLIPTGWYPSALALSGDDKALFVTNARGAGSLERIDLEPVNLALTTRAALAMTRATRPAPKNPIVPQTVLDGPSKRIKHVVVIVEEAKTFDAVFGDYDGGDPSSLKFGETVTPNLHALARRYGLAVDMFAAADDAAAAAQFLLGGIASDYTERTMLARAGRFTVADENEDPEDYPRAGYVFDNLARHGMSYRDYGGLLQVAGSDEGAYPLDVPAPRSLGGHVDLNFPGWNPLVSDTRRAGEFVRDFTSLSEAGRVPSFAYVWLPGDRSDDAAQVADGDRALGTIVGAISHAPAWRQTAIFILPADAEGSADHVDASRVYGLVVSPYAKRGYLGRRHLSTVSVLKTAQEILGLPALSLGDLVASDMADFFSSRPNFAPFTPVP